MTSDLSYLNFIVKEFALPFSEVTHLLSVSKVSYKESMVTYLVPVNVLDMLG